MFRNSFVYMFICDNFFQRNRKLSTQFSLEIFTRKANDGCCVGVKHDTQNWIITTTHINKIQLTIREGFFSLVWEWESEKDKILRKWNHQVENGFIQTRWSNRTSSVFVIHLYRSIERNKLPTTESHHHQQPRNETDAMLQLIASHCGRCFLY